MRVKKKGELPVFRIIKIIVIMWFTIFFIVPMLIGASIRQAHSEPLTKLEQSYVADANHATYAFLLNVKCHYMPFKTLTTVTDSVIATAKVAVGADRMDQYDNTTGRKVLIKLSGIAKYLDTLSKPELAKSCKEHRAEFNRTYHYLVSLSDESAETDDD